MRDEREGVLYLKMQRGFLLQCCKAELHFLLCLMEPSRQQKIDSVPFLSFFLLVNKKPKTPEGGDTA